jgi:serine/threonine protein kinase
MIGRAISHYRVLSALGSGGMGIVYLAEDERLGRQVALKFLPPDSVKNRQALDRFRVEARAASSLSHPGICAIYDIGDDEGTPFIVMEALKGETLRDRINHGPMKIGDLVDIGIQLADALEAAHTQGIIHRDIKPSNIFIGEKNRAKILDFGLAKLASGPTGISGDGKRVDASTHQTIVKQITLPGSALGTVSYMSPEQARGEDVDTRTDLFSLGTVLYEMAAGTQAFGGTTPAIVFDAILNHTPAPLIELNHMVPPRLEQIISTLLEKDRDLRYQHASDLQAELKRLRRDLDSGTLVGVGSSRTSVTTAPASRPPSSRQIGPPAPTPQPTTTWRYAIGVLAVLTAGAVGFMIWSGRSQNTATVAPEAPATQATPATQAGPETPPPATPVPETSPAPTPLPTTPVAPPVTTAKALKPPVETKPETKPATPPGRGATPTPNTTPVEPTPTATAKPPAPQTTASVPAPAPTPPPAPAAPTSPAPGEQKAVAPQPQPTPTRPPESAPPAQPASAQPAPAQTPVQPPPVPAQPTARAAAPPAVPPTSPVESDDAAIRRAVNTFKTAIETKNVGLYRSVRPGLTAAEETRLRDSFREVESQQITISIDDIRIDGRMATVRLSRQDVAITSGGRRQTQSLRQTLRLEKSATGWIITAIGG